MAIRDYAAALAARAGRDAWRHDTFFRVLALRTVTNRAARKQ